MNMHQTHNQPGVEKKYYLIIGIISVLIPVVVALLLFIPKKIAFDSNWIKFLPHLNGMINSATTIMLLLGFVFIKRKKIQLHKLSMIIAFCLGTIFLVSYIIYHSSVEPTSFGDLNGDGILEQKELFEVGILRDIYIFILISHIILAAVVVPFVLLAMYFGLYNKIDRHRKIVKYTFPIWLYVSISGVLVYLMISPYYQY